MRPLAPLAERAGDRRAGDFVRQWRDARTVRGEHARSAVRRRACIGLALGDAFGALVSSAGFDAATLTGAKLVARAADASLRDWRGYRDDQRRR